MAQKTKSHVRRNMRRQRKAKNYLNKLLEESPPLKIDNKKRRQQLYLFFDEDEIV